MELKSNFTGKAERDYLLVIKATKGDQQAFAELLEYYREAIYFMLLKMVVIKTDAEDLTIEAFTKAFKNLDLYTPSHAFSTWLFKIASNNAIDFLRKKKFRQQMISIDKEYKTQDEEYSNTLSLISSNPDPEEKLINTQKKDNILQILDRLPATYRKIIKLRFYDECSYTEISKILGIPIGTAKARLHRSRELLTGIIQRRGLKF